jgi:hypothetical protein
MDVFAFMDLGHDSTTAVTTGKHSLKNEVVLLAPDGAARPCVHRFLHLVEQVFRDNGFMGAVVENLFPVEIALVLIGFEL